MSNKKNTLIFWSNTIGLFFAVLYIVIYFTQKTPSFLFATIAAISFFVSYIASKKVTDFFAGAIWTMNSFFILLKIIG